MIRWELPVAAVLVASLDWWSLWKGWALVDYIAKPATVGLLAGWLASQPGWPGSLLVWFTAGLVFSLVGDVLLMLPQERFTGGLLAFLMGHLAYIFGLVEGAPLLGFPTLVLLVPLTGLAAWLFIHIRRGLRVSGRGALQWPVGVYSLVITLMLATALTTLTRTDWGREAAIVLSAGAASFYLSDALLAWNRFVSAVPSGRLKVRVAYHIGQVALAAGVVLQTVG